MNIIWNQNPFKTHLELDERDKALIYALTRQSVYEDMVYDCTTVDEIFSDRLLERVAAEATRLMSYYVPELENGASHLGDCCSDCTSCTRCVAEEMCVVDTMAGIGSNRRYIRAAFSNIPANQSDNLINLVINDLLVSPVVPNWNASEDLIQKWTSEKRAAAQWLIAYRDAHIDFWKSRNEWD